MGVMTFAVYSAVAGIWFRGDSSTRQGNWDDLNCWWTWYTYQNHVTSLSNPGDVNIPYGHTVIVSGTTAKCYSLAAFSNDANHPATVRIVSGGALNVTGGGTEEIGKVTGIYGEAYKYGCLDIQSGGTNTGILVVGGAGVGIVTNAGYNSFGGGMKIARDPGSSGTYVHDGGYNRFPYARDIDIGMNGSGKLIVRSGTFNFTWYANGNNVVGYTRIGCGDGGGTGVVQIEDGTVFEAGLPYLGGNATTVGDGRVQIKGGTFKVKSNLGAKHGVDSMWIGAATDDAGGVRDGSYGEISGWGKVTSAYTEVNSVSARIGNGVIIADGEGEERVLDCSAMWQVTNVIFDAESKRTNGWYAVNKGAVLLPGVNVVLDNGGDNRTFLEGSNAVGCSRGLVKPDLINAVFVDVMVPYKQAGKNLAVMLLASDRSDAHAEALTERYKAIGFWKVGVFDSRTVFAADTRQGMQRARVDFRYDHNKVSNPDNRLAVLRWNSTAGKWTRLSTHDEQPDDYIVSTGTFTDESDDPVWGIGLFCVAEVEPKGTVISVR